MDDWTVENLRAVGAVGSALETTQAERDAALREVTATQLALADARKEGATLASDVIAAARAVRGYHAEYSRDSDVCRMLDDIHQLLTGEVIE